MSIYEGNEWEQEGIIHNWWNNKLKNRGKLSPLTVNKCQKFLQIIDNLFYKAFSCKHNAANMMTTL